MMHTMDTRNCNSHKEELVGTVLNKGRQGRLNLSLIFLKIKRTQGNVSGAMTTNQSEPVNAQL